MLNSLSNPKTPHYEEFKKWALGPQFFWTWHEEGGVSLQHLAKAGISKKFYPTIENEDNQNVPFYTRTFIRRPEIRKYPSVDQADPSEVDNVVKVLSEIFEHNNLPLHSLLRLSVNACHPEKEIISSYPHYDHDFPHKNLIIYLTDAGGSTFVDGEEHNPKEDDVIHFTGQHYHKTPAENRRVILVATMV